jgi:D-glycero-alpha-D-manno-heptose-7-phosphate kinase
MRMLAESMAESLAAGDLDTLGKLVGENWTYQRALNSAIPTPAIDEIIARGREAGAIGGKALGASGGGCVLLIARSDKVQEVRTAVESLGEIISFTIAAHGVERWP